MRKIILVLSLLLISGLSFSAKEVKKTDEVKEVKKVTVDNFEGEKCNWNGLAFISAKEGGQEQSTEDTIKVDINKNEKYVKNGKQSLKVEYSVKNPSDLKFAQISIVSDKPIGENNAISFWLFKAKGKASLEFALFDNVSWKKRLSQAVPLNFEGWKLITLSLDEFTTSPNWDKGKARVLQIAVRGETNFYLDDLKFTKK
ncbi:MAG: chondroitinase family protein [Candidatus Firestonebacteria bacterium]